MALTQVGRYRIEREVARGGMGAVYRARDPEGRPVALKLLLAGQSASPLQRRRVATEIQTLLRLRHENVVELLDAGEHEGVPWLAMEWVEGETLAARIARQGPLPWNQAAGLVLRLALAVEHCHAQGVLHRDLKPGNVMLRAGDGLPLLTDFGLSKDVASESQTTIAKTIAGRWLGTPGYWPPEQARGATEQIGPRSDVYGLGALLYACLTGVPPQEGETLAELMAALDRPPVPPSQRRPGLPPWLEAECLRALALDPAQRQARAVDLARGLEEGLAGRLRPPPTDRVARSPASPGSPAVWVVVALLFLGGVVAGAGVVLGGGGPTPPVAAPSLRPPEPPPASREPAPNDAPSTDPAQRPQPAPLPPETRAEIARLMDSAQARFQAGDLRRTLADYGRVIELDPRNALAYTFRGLVYDELDDPARALADMDRAIELDPRNSMAYGNRAYVRHKQGDVARALADTERAIELDPRNAMARLIRGLAREEQGDLGGALADWERFLELAPDSPQAGAVRMKVERLRAHLAPR